MDNENAAMAKKMKKKKKKKHRHKEKKDRGKDALDFSNSEIPGVHRDLLDDRLAANSPPVLTNTSSLQPSTSFLDDNQAIAHSGELDLTEDTFQSVSPVTFRNFSDGSDSG